MAGRCSSATAATAALAPVVRCHLASAPASAPTPFAASAAIISARWHASSSGNNSSSSGSSSKKPGGAASTPPPPPPIAPDDRSAESSGRSSQTVSAVRADGPAADPRLRQVVADVFAVYEMRSADEQAREIFRLYARDAVYTNSIMSAKGVDAIARRFSLLPRTTRSVRVAYEPPVVLGATAAAPGALGDLSRKGDVQVEVKNSQRCECSVPSPCLPACIWPSCNLLYF